MTHHCSTRPRWRSCPQALACAMLALFALLAPAAPAPAQGARPFAAPLSSADLARWLDRLAPDAPGRAAITAAFEATLAEEQALRDGEMAEYETDWATNPSRSLSNEELDQRSRRARGIASRQAALEDRLFDSIAEFVPESRRAVVDDERRAATRRRALATLDPAMRAGFSPDLVGIAIRTWAGAPAPDAAWAALRAYDRELTGELEKAQSLALASEPAQRTALERIAAADPAPAEGDAAGEAAMARRMRNSMKARAEASAPIAERRARAAAAHRAALDAVCATLPEERAFELREAFVRAAYPMVGLKRRSPQAVLERALAESKAAGTPIAPGAVDDAQRIVTAWRRDDDAIARRMMDAIDARRAARGDGPMMVFAGDEPGPEVSFDDPLADLRTEREALDERVRQQLATIDPALAAIVGEPAQPQVAFGPGAPAGAVIGGEVRMSAVMIMDGGEGVADAITITMPEGGMIGAGGAGAPLRAIDSQEFDRLTARMALGSERTALLRTAWDRYRTTADAAMQEMLGSSTTTTFSGPDGMAFISTSDEDSSPPDVAAAMARLVAEDDLFFAELEAIAGAGPALDRERGIRARDRWRQRLAAANRMSARPWGRFERVDLPSIAAASTLSAADRAAIEPIVAAQGDRMASLLAQLSAALDEVRRIERAAIERIEGADGQVEERINLGGDEWQKAHAALQSAQEAVTADVRLALDLVSQALPRAAARSIRRAAYLAAMPEVMNDRRAADDRLEQALAIESLSDEKRLAIVELLSRHQQSVDGLVDRFIEDALEREQRHAARQQPGPSEIRAMRSADALQQRLRFDRSEVNDATMRRLRALLDADQNRLIADLPAGAGDGSGGVSFLSLPL